MQEHEVALDEESVKTLVDFFELLAEIEAEDVYSE
jgi:hypothetical protein